MSVTIQELEKLSSEIADLRVKEAEASAAKKAVTTELESKEREFITKLTAEGLTSYRGSKGLLSIGYRTSVKLPKTDEDRQAFFDYLKSKGLYDSMISVNSMTLNSFYKEEFERSVEEGNDNFAIPGIKEISTTETLSFRKS